MEVHFFVCPSYLMKSIILKFVKIKKGNEDIIY